MAKYKVILVMDECTSCESCVSSCPASYEMADDGLAHVKGSKRAGNNDELETNTLDCLKLEPKRVR